MDDSRPHYEPLAIPSSNYRESNNICHSRQLWTLTVNRNAMDGRREELFQQLVERRGIHNIVSAAPLDRGSDPRTDASDLKLTEARGDFSSSDS